MITVRSGVGNPRTNAHRLPTRRQFLFSRHQHMEKLYVSRRKPHLCLDYESSIIDPVGLWRKRRCVLYTTFHVPIPRHVCRCYYFITLRMM